MGTWGTGIFSDDEAADIRDAYRDFVGEGLTGAEATRRLLTEYADSLNDPDVGPVFWLALAATQLRVGRLEQSVKERAIEVIDSGVDLRRWSDDPKLARRRQAVLVKLRARLQGPPRPPTRIRKPYRHSTEFAPGDAIAYALDDQRFAILRVVDMFSDPSGTAPVVEILDWIGETPPAPDVLELLPSKRGASGEPLMFIVFRWSATLYPANRITLLARGLRRSPRDEHWWMGTKWWQLPQSILERHPDSWQEDLSTYLERVFGS